MVTHRYLQPIIRTICFPKHKMAFISGPRQCGKTTCAKQILRERGAGEYFNWDEKRFRSGWTKDPLALLTKTTTTASIPLIVLDEIHKAKSWKRDLKGVYDSLTTPMDILITGSAKLNAYRRGSDSLLGRYHHFRLHPFSLAELLHNKHSVPCNALIDKAYTQVTRTNSLATKHLASLLQFGPFPDPLFAANPRTLRLWQRERVERLVREDLRDLSRIQELSQVEMLVSILPERAANVLSINALREDLEVAYATMKLWIDYLKYVYYLFEVKPYAKSIPRALKKEGKIYLWDWSEIEDPGARFENMIASHLLKFAHYMTDTGEADVELRYLRNKQKQEIDFLLVKDKKPWLPIEVKFSETSPAKNWAFYFKHLPCNRGIQVIQKPGVKKIVAIESGEILIISAELFLPLLM
jgi:predicted AAA+ superfamily ATPase